MKKAFTLPTIKVLIIGLILTISQISFSQSGIRFGIRGGVHAGTPWGRAIIANPESIKVGFEGALFADIALSEDISLCPEIAFNQKGFKADTILNSSNYLEVPLLVKINMGDGGMYTVIGPYISYLPTLNDNAPEEKSFGWGGIFGLGYRISDHIFLEGRYNFSGNIWKLGSDSPNPLGFRNTSTGISLGFIF